LPGRAGGQRTRCGSSPRSFGGALGFDAYLCCSLTYLTRSRESAGAAADVPCVTEYASLIKAKYATPFHRWTHLAAAAAAVGC